MQAVRLHITATTGTNWAFLSEVQLVNDAGQPINPCASPTASTTTPDNVPMTGTAACVLISDTDTAAFSSTYTAQAGEKLTAQSAPSVNTGAGTANPDPATATGWCATTNCPAAASAGFDIVTDLGQNQPIGALTSDWYTLPSWGIGLPAQISYSYQTDPGTNPNLTTGWTPAPAAATSSNGNLVSYRSTIAAATDTTTGKITPVTARWVKTHITTTAGAQSWIMAASLAAYTPPAEDLTANRTPTLYPTGNTTNPNHNPNDPTTGNPTSTDPTANALQLPKDTVTGHAAPADCSASNTTGCAAHSSYGTKALTATDPTTGLPVAANWTEPWKPDANVLHLAGSPGWDITVPLSDPITGSAPYATTINATTLTFSQSTKEGATLPTSIDAFYSTTWNADWTLPDDANTTWTWTGHTAVKPTLPPYLPNNTILTTTYTIPTFTGTKPSGITSTLAKLRLHINTGPTNIIETTHLHTTTWRDGTRTK